MKHLVLLGGNQYDNCTINYWLLKIYNLLVFLHLVFIRVPQRDDIQEIYLYISYVTNILLVKWFHCSGNIFEASLDNTVVQLII